MKSPCSPAFLLIFSYVLSSEALFAEDGWVSLFNGKDLSGWVEPEVAGLWAVKDGVIDCAPKLKPKGEKNLWSEGEFGDFELEVEWRIKEKRGTFNTPVVLPDGSYKMDEDGKRITNPGPGADSGIYLRGVGKSQVNIWCWPIGSGEVYGYRNNQKDPEIRAGVTPRTNADKPVGEWNKFLIKMKGDRLTVVLNGKTVIENARLPGIPEKGPIALQHHGGYDEEKKVWNGASSLVQFRSLRIRELSSE
ncbi:MAG: DUF1080 domain-containing protein [Verrucomicrobiota bacterium]